jgi:hypothetical protein
MKCNMGKWDRVLRGGLGIAIMGAGLLYGSWWGLIGLIPFLTSMVAWCPAYVPFKISTAPKGEE